VLFINLSLHEYLLVIILLFVINYKEVARYPNKTSLNTLKFVVARKEVIAKNAVIRCLGWIQL